MPQKEHRAILQTGHNCWRRENARQVAIAIDGAAYFRAVREAILAARHSVFILGWDIHSKLKLVRDIEKDGFPEELGALLDFVAKQRAVDVYVLSWDFAMIYLIEREPLPLYVLNYKVWPGNAMLLKYWWAGAMERPVSASSGDWRGISAKYYVFVRMLSRCRENVAPLCHVKKYCPARRR